MLETFKQYPITLSLIVICIAIYVIQVLSGVHMTSPASTDLVKWGANHMLLTLNHDWWRTITAVFLHIGLMHLMFNAYALYIFGQVCEKLFGSVYFLGLFLLAGVAGNLLNNAYALLKLGEVTDFNQLLGIPVSAGASGGIMGLGGALFVLALLKVRIGGMVLHFKTIAIIMLINLGFGFAVPGIDNPAHIGGMLTGAILAASYVLASKNNTNFKVGLAMQLMMLLIVAGLYVLTYEYLQSIFYSHVFDTLQPMLALGA